MMIPQASLSPCPSCGIEVDPTEEVCPYCGYEFPVQRRSVGVAAMVMALLLLWPIIKLIQYLAS